MDKLLEWIEFFKAANQKLLYPILGGFITGLIVMGVFWTKHSVTIRMFNRTLHSPPVHSCEYCNVGD